MSVVNPSDQRRMQLVETAKKLFIKKGFYETAVSDIVKECGVAQGTFYYYFKTKEDILRDVISAISFYHLENLKKKLQKIESPKEKLRYMIESGFCRNSVKSLHKNPKAINTASLKLLGFDLIKTLHENIQPLLYEIIADGIQKKEFSVAHPDFTITAIIGVSKEIMLNYLFSEQKQTDFSLLSKQFFDFYERILNTSFA